MNQLKDTRRMTIFEADKGYDSDKFRQEVLDLGYLPVISYRRSKIDKISMKEVANFFGFTRKRWVVERTFSWIKRKCRRLMLRWERLPKIWGAFATLGLIFMWLQDLVG